LRWREQATPGWTMRMEPAVDAFTIIFGARRRAPNPLVNAGHRSWDKPTPRTATFDRRHRLSSVEGVSA
jgi:hypothetical protein